MTNAFRREYPGKIVEDKLLWRVEKAHDKHEDWMHIKSYMDYHLSICHHVMSDEALDLTPFEMWDAGMEDW